jgi:hypothetical protein
MSTLAEREEVLQRAHDVAAGKQALILFSELSEALSDSLEQEKKLRRAADGALRELGSIVSSLDMRYVKNARIILAASLSPNGSSEAGADTSPGGHK